MIFRTLAIALLIANLGYFAWAHGAFAVFGSAPARFSETEPHRLAQQVRPEMLRIVQDANPTTSKP
ncbi:MAG: sporulation protein [Gammaproteobacteria bacterium]|nr:sporulation protein [Gammaproteobacteria bacterium]MBU2407783.1 sporulation protein [Gammaproteobacteria bacterium]